MAEEIILKAKLDTANAETGSKSLKQQLREAQKEAQELGASVGEFDKRTQAAARRAAELRDQLDDVNDAVRSFTGAGQFEAATRAMAGLSGGIQAATGLMTVFGVENENVGKALVRLQGAMALTQGLQALEDLPRAWQQLTTVITTNTVVVKVNDIATKAATATMGAFGVATTGTGIAFNVLKGAIIATGIGALVVAIGFAVNALVEWVGETEDAADAQKKLNEEIDKGVEKVQSQYKTNRMRVEAMKDGIEKERALIRADQQERLLEQGAANAKNNLEYSEFLERRKAIIQDTNNKLAAVEKKYADEAEKKEKERRDKALAAEMEQQKERLRIEKIDIDFRNEQAMLAYEMRTANEEKAATDFAKSLEDGQKRMKRNLDLMAVDMQQATLNTAQQLIRDETLSYEERLAALKDFREKGKLTEQQYTDAIIQLKEAEKKAEQDKALAIGGAFNAIGNLIGQNTEFGKAAGIASATIDTFVGAQKAMGQTGILGIASAVAIIANGLANVRRIMAVQIPKPPGGGGGGMSGSVSAPTAPPMITQTALVQNSPIETTSSNQRVFVLEQDIRSTTNRVNVLQSRGSVG